MKNILLSIFLTVASVLALSACGGGSGKFADPIEEDYEHGPFLGDLDKKLAEAYGKDREVFFEPCDFQNRRKILEIGRVLEKRRAEITAFNEAKRESSKNDYLKLGDFQFSKTKTTETEDKWSEEEWSWADLIQEYEYIKTNPKPEYWNWLNTAVRGVVSDDADRLDGAFYGAKRNSGPMVGAIEEVITACDANRKCTNPPFTPEQKEFLNNSGTFRFYWKDFESSAYEKEEKRKDIARLKRIIQKIAELYTFKPYEGAHRDGNTLVIPMDFSVFGSDAENAMNEMIQPWNVDPAFKIRIENVPKSDKAYNVQVSEILGERAFVSRTKLLMQLYNFTGVKVLSHEFGHILGFQDNYFTSWDKASCKYKFEVNAGDIMSGNGKVLPRHWEKLKKVYFLKATAAPEKPSSASATTATLLRH